MKLSLRHILREVEQNEQIEDQTQDPAVDDQGQAMVQQQAAPPEATPKQTAGQNQSALAEIVGSTVSDISYEKVGANGGKVTIKTSNSHVPFVLSWVGSKVTITKQNGTVVMLSSEG